MSNDSESEPPDRPPPARWWLTAYGRSLYDFNWLAGPEGKNPFFSQLETLEGFATQRRDVSKKYETYMVLSFIGASLVLAGGFPADSKISFWGLEGSSKVISIPLLSGLVAGLFSRCVQLLLSVTLLTDMIDGVLCRHVPDGPEFVIARYDAASLWTNLLRRRVIGYQTPWPLTILGAAIPISGLLWLVLYVSVVWAATWSAFSHTKELWSFPFFVALLAVVMVVVTVAILVASLLIPMPYRMSKEMKEFIDKGAPAEPVA